MNSEIDEAIMEFLRLTYGSPKQLFREIYPIFQNRYPDDDTFQRLIRRSLQRLKKAGEIVEHPIRPYYCLGNHEWLASHEIIRGLKQGNLVLEHDNKFGIISATGPPVNDGQYLFAEYFRKMKDILKECTSS